jgi:acetyl-CoA carboxylase biotin carboxyl carrier protein
MTMNSAPRLSPVQDSGPEPDDDPQVLERLREVALSLLGGLAKQPASLRISTTQVELELKWPESMAEMPAVSAAVSAPADAAAAPATEPAGRYLTAHSVGVFYRAPEPGAKPFVGVGDVVLPGQQLGIIEAMKLMIPVEADIAGRIVEVIAGDGQAVEYGDPLFAFEPAGS